MALADELKKLNETEEIQKSGASEFSDILTKYATQKAEGLGLAELAKPLQYLAPLDAKSRAMLYGKAYGEGKPQGSQAFGDFMRGFTGSRETPTTSTSASSSLGIKDILGMQKDANASDMDKIKFTRDLKNDFEKPKTAWGAIVDNSKKTIMSLGQGTGASDIAAIKAWEKSMDPTSVIREAEFNIDAETAGVVSSFITKVKNIVEMSGERLNPEARRQIADIVSKTYKIYEDAFANKVAENIDFAKQAGVSVRSVIGQPVYMDDNWINTELNGKGFKDEEKTPSAPVKKVPPSENKSLENI